MKAGYETARRIVETRLSKKVQECLPIKICGMMSSEAGVAAAKSGAHFLGFNFVDGVRRHISLDQAVKIIRDVKTADIPNHPLPFFVGLFRNQEMGWVNKVSRETSLDFVQLCGEENEDYISNIRLPIVRQLRYRQPEDLEQLATETDLHLSKGRMVILDRYDASAAGGTGKQWDWGVVKNIANRAGVLLAGGLTPENVREVVRTVVPWGVDVASGVETDGVKSPQRINDFIRSAKKAQMALKS